MNTHTLPVVFSISLSLSLADENGVVVSSSATLFISLPHLIFCPFFYFTTVSKTLFRVMNTSPCILTCVFFYLLLFSSFLFLHCCLSLLLPVCSSNIVCGFSERCLIGFTEWSGTVPYSSSSVSDLRAAEERGRKEKKGNRSSLCRSALSTYLSTALALFLRAAPRRTLALDCARSGIVLLSLARCSKRPERRCTFLRERERRAFFANNSLPLSFFLCNQLSPHFPFVSFTPIHI